MPGGSASINRLVTALALAAAAPAQVPDYFPLETGNVWVYRTRGTPPRLGVGDLMVEVGRAESFGGRVYFAVRQFHEGEYWLRNDGEGRVFQFDEKTGEEKLWFDFSKKNGEIYATAVPSCCGRVGVEDTAASKQIALGSFDRTVYRHSYPGVFQVGINEEDFLPYVGMVFRSTNTGGPSVREHDLVYARLSGVTVLNASGLGFGVAATAGGVRIFVNNNTREPMRLIFPSGQTYDVVVRDASEKELYRWSSGRGFTEATRAVTIAPGETSWPASLPEIPGAASLEAILTSAGRPFRAMVPYPKP